MSDPILVWEFHDAPDELKACSGCGGDEDYIVVVPPGMACPFKLEQLGCCSNDMFRVTGSGVVERRIELAYDEEGDGYRWEETGNTCPTYVNHTFIISSHA